MGLKKKGLKTVESKRYGLETNEPKKAWNTFFLMSLYGRQDTKAVIVIIISKGNRRSYRARRADWDKTAFGSSLYIIPCTICRYSSSVLAEARRAAVWAFQTRNFDWGWWSMMGAVWCFCSHSITANLELLDSAAKESHHLILNLWTSTGCPFCRL